VFPLQYGVAFCLRVETCDARGNVAGVTRPKSAGYVETSTAKGFTLSMVKAIMSRRVDESIELAKTNLWR
jgi:hypothetical protein